MTNGLCSESLYHLQLTLYLAYILTSYFCMLPGISLHSIWHISWHSTVHVFSIFSDTYSDLVSHMFNMYPRNSNICYEHLWTYVFSIMGSLPFIRIPFICLWYTFHIHGIPILQITIPIGGVFTIPKLAWFMALFYPHWSSHPFFIKLNFVG